MQIKLRFGADAGSARAMAGGADAGHAGFGAAGAVARRPEAQGLAGWLLGALRQRMTKAPGRRMEVLETLALGPKRHLTLVACDGRRFLVGGGADSVGTIVAVGEGLAAATGADEADAHQANEANQAYPANPAARASRREQRAAPAETFQGRNSAADAARPSTQGIEDAPPPQPAAAHPVADFDDRRCPEVAAQAAPPKPSAQVAEEILEALRKMQVSAAANGELPSSDLTRGRNFPFDRAVDGSDGRRNDFGGWRDGGGADRVRVAVRDATQRLGGSRAEGRFLSEGVSQGNPGRPAAAASVEHEAAERLRPHAVGSVGGWA